MQVAHRSARLMHVMHRSDAPDVTEGQDMQFLHRRPGAVMATRWDRIEALAQGPFERD
jgi:hypothetical protein